MANLAITAAEVLPTTTPTQTLSGIAGAAISAGDVVYYDTSSLSWKLFDADNTGANTKTPGVAMNSAASGQTVTVAVGGDLTIGATAAAVTGTIYVASATPGKMCPAADLATTYRVVIIGIGKATAKLQLVLNNTGVTLP